MAERTLGYRSTATLRTLDGNRLDPRSRAAWWLELNWDTWAEQVRWLPYSPDWVDRLLCWTLGGHTPISDQGGRPEHDYCAWCGRRTPAVRGGEGRSRAPSAAAAHADRAVGLPRSA